MSRIVVPVLAGSIAGVVIGTGLALYVVSWVMEGVERVVSK